MGVKTVLALTLVGEVIYGAKHSYEDPARCSFAHGGKDAAPFPVDSATYDTTIAIMAHALGRVRLIPFEKGKVMLRLMA